MRDKNIFDRENLDILTENKGTEVLNKRSALKTRICAFITLLVVCIFTAVFGFIWNFAPINTTDSDKDNTAYAATAAEEWTSIIQAGGGTFTLQSDWVAPSGSFGTRTADGYYKGALLVDGIDVTIDLNGHAINRKLSVTTDYGTVIYVINGGTLTVKDSSGNNSGTITGGYSSRSNDTYTGGGIGVGASSTLNFESGTLSNNRTTASISGAAISARMGSTINITGGIISNNTADGKYSGAITIYQSTATLSNVQIINNKTNGTYSGAAVTVYDNGSTVPVTLSECTISGNTAIESYSAGGMMIYGSTDINISNCVLDSNTASSTSNYNGGGIFVNYESACEVSNTSITNCKAPGTLSGGGVALYSSSSIYLNGCSISGNIAGGATGGGGVYIHSGTAAEITGGSISGNKGGLAGGIYVISGSTLKVGGSLKVENNTLYSGGATSNVIFATTAGVENKTGTMIVSSTLLSGAHIGVTKTGNNYDFSLARITEGLPAVNNPVEYFFADQSPDYGISSLNGEAVIYCYNNEKNWNDACIASTDSAAQTFILYSDWTASSKSFGTAASFIDGALYLKYNQSVVIDLNGHTINRNCGTSNTASGYVIQSKGNLEIKDSVGGGKITGGRNSDGNGGGLYAYGGTVSMSGGSITGNTSSGTAGLGGGIYLQGCTFTMTGGEISGNTALENGGGIYIYTGTFNFEGGVISGNTAKNGGGVYVQGGDAFNMNGGAVTGNSASSTAGGVYVNTNRTFTMGGASYVYGNTQGSNQSNVYLLSNTQMITITSPITATQKTGVVRGLIGEFTTGWAKNMSGVAPETFFESDSDEMYVMTYSTGEGAFLSTDNETNWTSAVKNSRAEGNTHTVKMTKDWIAKSGSFGTDTTAFWSGGLYVPDGASIILDLNGRKIDRQSFSTSQSSPIIRINGTLEIIDSSAAQTGTITGNYNTHSSTGGAGNRAGGISISSGTLTMRAGTISNCKVDTSSGAGGVQVYAGTFNMYGGTITGCSNIADGVAGGGGVYVLNYGDTPGVFNFYGGTVSGNAAVYSSKCVAAGVCVGNSAVLNVSGDVKICDNYFTDGTGSDVFLGDAEGKINIVGKLSSDARIGFRREVNNYNYPYGSDFTNDYSRYNTDDIVEHFFASETARHRVIPGEPEGRLWCIDNVTNWSNAYNAGSGTVTLYSDWTSASDKTMGGEVTKGYLDGALYVNGGNIVLDLNGYTIDRNVTTAKASGYVIYLRSGSLTIIDSRGGGKITGGYTSDGLGGGVYLYSGTLTLTGGEITGNKSSTVGGGGVYIRTGAEFNIGGNAAVYDNTAKSVPSNLYCLNVNQMINVVEKMTNTAHKSGITRDKNGEFTVGFATANNGANAADYFSCDLDTFFVLNAATGEGSLLTTNNSSNWEDAVLASLAADGAEQTVALCKNWLPSSGASFGDNTKAFYEGAMQVPSGATILLDLNGFTIDRGLTSVREYGFLFLVRGKLTIIDSKGGGVITGGYNSYATRDTYCAGAIGISSGGALYLNGGTITGNRSTGESGVGGVAVIGEFFMHGGAVTGNSGKYVGGVYVSSTENDSYNNHGLYVSGTARIEDNTKTDGTTKSNLYYFTQTHLIKVDGKLEDGARIGISRTNNINNYEAENDNRFTSGYSAYNTADPYTYFFSDSSKFIVTSSTVNNTTEGKLFCVDNATNWNNALAYGTATFTLYSDWTAGNNASYSTSFQDPELSANYFRNGALYIPSGRDIVLDLNGFIINRNLKSAVDNGYAIISEGTLTITDTTGSGRGKITGGYNSDGTGGVYLNGSSKLTMKSGEISGNIGSSGAGVYVNTNAELYLGGTARIENNTNLAGVASNIYLTGETKLLHIVSKVEPGRVYGITRLANGDVTEGWVKYNSGVSPENFFTSEHSNYECITGGTGELAFLSSYNDLNWQSAVIASLGAGGATQTVRLKSDWIPDGGTFGTGTGFYGGMLYVPSGASIYLDMNGYSINRGLTTAIENGGVFRVLGTLTIVDATSTSVITGGYNLYGSYGRAGGIYVGTGGYVDISGVTISGNIGTSTRGASGVYVSEGSVFNMHDSSITGNTGEVYGGVVIDGGSTFKVGGKTVIEGNTISGGLSRDIMFLDNYTPIYLNSALTTGSHIGVYKLANNYLSDGHNIVTSGYSTCNTEAVNTYFFASDAPDHGIIEQDGEVALYCYNNAMNWVNAYNASTTDTITFTLYSDWEASNGNFGIEKGYYGSGALRVYSSRSLIIDLNGHKIDRKLSMAKEDGYVIWTEGNLTIVDSVGGGIITGGCTSSAGVASGINAHSGILTLEGGTISGNVGAYGVYVYRYATLNLGGSAKVVGNTNGSKDANIYIHNVNSNVNIISAFTDGAEFGITREANGVFTQNYGKYNTAAPSTYFTSEDDRFYVTDNGLTDDSLEGFFLSTDPMINWQFAVRQSIAKGGATETFRLLTDWNAKDGSFGTSTGFRSGSLFVPSEASIILDLNGHTINKGNSTNAGNCVIFVDGSLEIIDASGNDSGSIIGGYFDAYNSNSYDRAAGINIRSGSVIMRGGTVTGNKAYSNGYDRYGGAVYVWADGEFTMLGGQITGNSGYKTGGVYVANGGTLNLGGSAKIYDNTRLDENGKVTTLKSDVYFQNTVGQINIVEPFNADAKVGITADPTKIVASGTVLTNGWSEHNPDVDPSTIFFSNQPTEYLITSVEGEGLIYCLNNSINWGNAVSMSLSTGETQTFRLYSDWEAETDRDYIKSFGTRTGYRYGALRVPYGASIILDLNGFYIDRGMTRGVDYGYVIYVDGDLTIIDSKVSQSGPIIQGYITGGWCSDNGRKTAGGIVVEYDGTLTLLGGAITGNKAFNASGDYNYSGGGGVSVCNSGTLNLGGTAQIYGNTDLNGNNSDVYIQTAENVINIVSPMRFADGDAGKIGVMRGGINNGKPTGLGDLTVDWGKYNPDEDPTAHFVADNEYIVVSSIDFGENCEAIVLSNDNLDNWVYAVTTSLSRNMTTRFTLARDWTAGAYTYYNYYTTSFGRVANCFQDGGLLVPKGASIVMDLNGFKIDRAHDTAKDERWAAFNFVIYVEGSLQIVDSSTGKTGSITGGSYGIQIAEDGFVCIGALPLEMDDKGYMDGSRYIIRDESVGSGSITGNSVYGVYSYAGTLAMTGGKITGNPVGAYMDKIAATDSNPTEKDSTVMLGGSAYIYSDDAATKDLVLTSLFSDIEIISAFTGGAKIGFHRDAIGQLTSGWGEHNGDNGTETDLRNYFISKGSDKFTVEAGSGEDGHLEVFLTSYDNLLNWQYAVSKSLATGKRQTFIMYGCWIADPDEKYVTSFGDTSAFINGALYVPDGANVLMNMNGHKLDRVLAGKGASSGYVIYVDGTLEIIDTQIANPTGVTLPDCYRDGGLITGGYNRSGSSGGAIHIGRGTLTLNGETLKIKDNLADSTSATAGAIYVGGRLDFKNGSIEGNQGDTAGGVYVASTGVMTMADGGNATITGNYAKGPGGGAIYACGTVNIEGGTLTKNSGMIGAVYVANNGKVTLSGNASITENKGGSAGGVYVCNSSTSYFDMNGGYITNNTALSAGGIYAAGRVNMTGGKISGNTAEGSTIDDGGSGMYLAGSANVTITGGEVTGNVGINGIRVYSSGTLNLGGSARIYENICNDPAFIEAEDTDGDGKAYNDIFLTAETRRITIVSQFTSDAHIGIYRIGAGVVTRNYGKFNTEHPDNYFFSNKHIYAIAVTTPEDGAYAEAVVGTPIDAPEQYLIDGNSPVYNGQWQPIIVGYDPAKMQSEVLPSYVKGDQTDADGNIIIEGVDARSYIIAFTLAPSYCWKDGSTAPKQIHAKIMPKQVNIIWEKETHTDEGGNTVDCKYDGVTVHVPKATVDSASLVTNVITGEMDECMVDVDGATVNASAGLTPGTGHTATAVMLSNPNYTLGVDPVQFEFFVDRAELPDFKITTTQAEFKTPCTIKVDGNIENGKLHFSLPDNPANVTIDEETGEFISSEKDLEKRIKVKVVVDNSANYYGTYAEGEIEVLPGKVHTEINETEVIYGDTLQLTLKDYDASEMGTITYTFSNGTGIGNVTGSGLLTTKHVGTINVTATIAASYLYAETVVEGTITILPRSITVNWDDMSATYDGNAHSPVVSIGDNLVAGDEGKLTLSVVRKGTDQPASFVNAGRYDVSVVLSDRNYKLATEEEYHNVYEIFKADITLSFRDKTAYYDTPFTPQIDGNLGGGAVTFVVDDTILRANGGNSFTPLDVGKTNITANVAESENYNAGTVTDTFEILPIDMKLTLTSTTTVYGDDLTLTAEGNDGSTVTFTVAAGYEEFAEIVNGVLIPKKVGTVKVLMSAPATRKYNAAVDQEGTVTITQREVEIIWGNLEFVYDKTGKLPTATVKADDLVNGDTCTVDTITVDGFAAAINAGSYTAVASGLSNPNYIPKPSSARHGYVIKPKLAVIEWETGVTYTYNGASQAPKASVTNLEDGDACNVIVLGTKNAATGITAMATGLDNSNYTLDGATNLTTVYDILPFPITVSWSNTTLVYNGREQIPTATANDLFAGDSCPVITTGGQTNVGVYTATAIGLLNPNYVLADGAHTTEFEIVKANLTDFDLADGNITYGTPYTLGVVNDRGGAVTYEIVGGAENVILTGDRIVPMNVGKVTVKATLAASENYDEATATREYAISPRPVTLRWEDTAFTYDKNLHCPRAYVDNLVNSDSCVVTVGGAQTNAGKYTASAISLSNNKYIIAGGTNLTQVYDIAPVAITIEWGDTELTYNGLEQHPSVTINGLLEGDTCSAVVEGAINAAINHTATLTLLTNSNYTAEYITNRTIKFNINQKVAELAWDNLDLTYNGSMQGPVARVTNLCGSDECTVTVAGWQTDVGEYSATAIGLSNTNYTLTGADNLEVTFNIGKADRSFALVNNRTVYGSELTLMVVGVEDDSTVTYSVTNATGSATLSGDVLTPTGAGLVYVTVEVGETANYKPASKTFEVTIDKYVVEIEWDYPEFIYDGTEHKPTPTVSNVLDGETCDVLGYTGYIHAGKACPAEVTEISNPNYTLVGGKNVKTTFTIRPRPISIEWDEDRTYVYDGTPKGPAAHVTDLIEGDTCPITVSGKNVNAGTYTARIVSLGNSDYTLDGAIGLTAEYVIERAQPTITIKTTNAILGINCPIEIEGNIGGGVVTFAIEAGDDIAYISGNMLVSHKVGTVTVRAYVGETINTLAAQATGEIEIDKGKAPLAMERTTVTYGNTLPLIVFDDDGFLRDDSGNLIFGDVTFTVIETDRAVIESGNILRPLKAGVLHVRMSTEETANYKATSLDVAITVNKRVVTLEWTDESFVYNRQEQNPTARVTNLVGNDVCTVIVRGNINAGTNLTATAIGLSDEENYTLSGAVNTEKTYDIAPLPVDIHWGELSMQFNGNHQYPRAWVDTIDNEPCTVRLEGGGKNVGKYEARATGLSNPNYVLTPDNLVVEFEITRAYINPVLSPDSAVYNESVQLILSGNLENGAVTYTVLADESTGNAEITGDMFLATKAGNVVIRINVDETANCYAYEGKATIFVDKAFRGEIDLVNNKTVYGETLTLEITGNEPEPGSVTYTVENVPLNPDEIDPDSPINPDDPRAAIDADGVTLLTRHAGKVYVTIFVAATENYKEITVVKEVEISPRIAEITWENTEFNYNGQVQTPTAVVSNLINGDECTVTVDGGYLSNGTQTASINAGTYTARVSKLSNPDYTYLGSLTANTVYTIGKVEIFIDIVNTHITIRHIEHLAITGNKGEAPVNYTVENGTGTAVITDISGTEAENGQYIQGTRLGTVIVTAYVPSTTNYLAAEVKALVIIEKDRPTITLINDTVTYGDTLKLEADGNVENGYVSYTVSNATGSATCSGGVLTPLKVGVVNVTVTVAATENYAMSSTTHEVTILPRPIQRIEWSNFEFTYDGITIWAPTGTVVGTLNNEPCDVIVGGGQIRAGRYTTAYAQALTNPNYTLAGAENINAPQFVINKVKPNIKILTTAITIGVPTIIEISGNNDNGKVIYSLENGTGAATIVDGIITGTQLGEVYLTVSIPETENYLFGSTSGVILVEKPAAPVTLETVETIYGTDLTLNILNNPENGAVTIALKDGTTLADLNGNVLTPKGVGEVIVVVTVGETDTYKETVKEITVTILPRPIEVSWEYPEFVYDKTEHKPIATITNLVGSDTCDFSVSGYINAGTDCPAYVYDLLNPNYTVEGGVNVNTTFTIKPRPVTLSWEENCVFIYNGAVQTPKATVTDALEGDTVNVSRIDGSKDVGENLVATAVETDNPNYTCEGGTNLTTTYAIRAYEVTDSDDIVWGDLSITYNGKVNVPKAYLINTFFDEKVFLDVRGDGIHVRQDPYIATIVGVLSPNYVLSESILNDLSVVQREYYITPATVTFDEEILVKEYSGEFQQPEFTIHLLAEDDDLYIEVSGGGTAVGNYNVDLTLMGTSVGDYVLSEADRTKLFEIVKKSLTLKIKADDRNERHTGLPVNTSGWTDWYTTELDGLLAADAGKGVRDLFTSDTLVLNPEIYLRLGDTEQSQAIEKGSYFILPAYVSGAIDGADNYVIKNIVYESGVLTIGGKMYLELNEDSEYRFIFEKEVELGFKYLRTYAEEGLVHGVDDIVGFDTYVLGHIPLGTTITEFLSNFNELTLSLLKLYTQNGDMIYENGNFVAGFESVKDDTGYFVGTGWRIEFGEPDSPDVVYLSVLGDMDGNGSLGVSDMAAVTSCIEGARTLDYIHRLSAMLTNKGSINASDVSAMSVVYNVGQDAIMDYFSYSVDL